ncbi:MAG: 1-acyl-sn-glycerol-3-phosphate acyltransferase [Spirochaetota bacterium]
MKSSDNQEQILSGLIVDGLSGYRKLLASFLCRKAELDDESIRIIREYNKKGAVVFASFQSSNIALLMLFKLFHKNGLTLPKIALEFNPVLLQTVSYVIKRIIRRIRQPFGRSGFLFGADKIKEELDENRPLVFSMISDAFFLKRYMEKKYDTLYYLVELQRNYDRDIFIIPQTIFWTRKPDTSVRLDADWRASADKTFLQAFFSSFTPSYVHMIEPLNLRELLLEHVEKSTEDIVHLLRDRLIELQQHEQRVVLGPVLAPKHEMMERVLYHRSVSSVIRRIGADENIPEKNLKRKAYSYYREIAADFSIRYIRFFLVILDWMFRKIFSGIKLSDTFLSTIKEASRSGSVVLVPCHRSHMDYLILSYTFYKNRIIPPHIAAGVNLSFFPLGNIFRHSGAFFIRRSFKNLKLYPVIFKQYVKTLVMDRYQIEFFIEGGRTRTGRLLAPRPGLLSFLIEAVEEGYADDLTFVPISINYDRVLEEGAYHAEVKGRAKKRENIGQILSGWKFLKKDYGYVYVSAGEPLSLVQMREQVSRDDLVPFIGKRIMQEIADAVTVSPVAFMTLSMLLQRQRGFAKEAVLSTATVLFDYILFAGIDRAHVFAEKSLDEIFADVLKSYMDDGIIEELDADGMPQKIYHITNDNRRLVSFYKNSISHYFLPLFITANCILRRSQTPYTRDSLASDYAELLGFLSHEFVLEKEDGQKSRAACGRVCDGFLKEGGFIDDEKLAPASDKARTEQLCIIAKGFQDIVESYYITYDTLAGIQQKKIPVSELMRRIGEHASALEFTDKVSTIESISVPVFRNALTYLEEKKIIEEEHLSRKKSRITLVDRDALIREHERVQSFIVRKGV